jgi:hypothetical protein
VGPAPNNAMSLPVKPHVQDIVLRRIWRDMQTVKVKIRHLHARMTEAILFRLTSELVFILDVERATRPDADDRRCVIALIAKFRFTRGRIRSRDQHHRRVRLRQFRKYSVLSTRSRKQCDVRDPAKCVGHELLQDLHRKNYRQLASIATTQA